jgi:hypothetical protein
MDVICINGHFSYEVLVFYKQYGVQVPIQDKIYYIRGVEHVRGKVGIFLEEIKNPDVPIQSVLSGIIYKEPSFNSSRFTTLLGGPIKLKELETILESD